MKKILLGALLLCAVGCSSDDTSGVSNGAGSNAGGESGASSEAGSHAGGNSNDSQAGSAAQPDAEAGMGGALDFDAAGAGGVGDAGAAGSSALGSAGEGGGSEAEGPNTCAAQHATALGAIDSVSTGEVTVVSTAAGVTTLYVNGTAGGTTGAATNPWTFLALGTAAKVSVTDVTASSSAAWDLALKRPLLYTNSGEAGPGLGGAVWISKTFEAVTAADAVGVELATEKFFDAACATILDPSGATLTTFATWYDYDPATHVLTPRTGTWLVHGASGKLFKLRIKTYYGTATGATGTAGGAYLLDVAAL